MGASRCSVCRPWLVAQAATEAGRDVDSTTAIDAAEALRAVRAAAA
ncbi:hypothetical protein [Streptomyces sp. NPDC046942]